MRMKNDKGEAVYFNPIRKHGKDQWVINQGHRLHRCAGP